MLLDSQARGGQGAGRGEGDTQLEHHDWGGQGAGGGGGDTQLGHHNWGGQVAGGGGVTHPGEHQDWGDDGCSKGVVWLNCILPFVSCVLAVCQAMEPTLPEAFNLDLLLRRGFLFGIFRSELHHPSC